MTFSEEVALHDYLEANPGWRFKNGKRYSYPWGLSKWNSVAHRIGRPDYQQDMHGDLFRHNVRKNAVRLANQGHPRSTARVGTLPMTEAITLLENGRAVQDELAPWVDGVHIPRWEPANISWQRALPTDSQYAALAKGISIMKLHKNDNKRRLWKSIPL